jgi:polyhydroxyalkanoate synthesis regulator phasin
MPQSKSSSRGKSAGSTRSKPASSRKSTGKPTSTARKPSSAPAPSQDSMREQLSRFLDPREVIVVTRERLQEALDEAVERGRMTRDDAGALLTELVQRGRKQTDDLRDDIEALLTGARTTTRRSVSGSAERVLREVDRARRAAGVGPSFPILGYDDLTAAQVTDRLGDLTPAELRKVRDYEKRNANRKSVLAAVEQKLE